MNEKRIPLMAANWKMFKTRAEAADFVNQLLNQIINIDYCEVAICPAFTALETVRNLLKGSRIALGAQDVFWQDEGAYTGEISSRMLKDLGCQYTIVGHSERRRYFAESDEQINKKIQTLYKHDINPICCVGETLEQRQAGQTMEIVKTQIKTCLNGLPAEKMRTTVIAYEPVWAIGTGHTATPDQAQEVQQFIRSLLKKMVGTQVAEQIRIQYGGSVKPDNIKQLMAMPDIDGALVGGASLNPQSFIQIVRYKD